MRSDPQANETTSSQDDPLFLVRIPEGQIFGPVGRQVVDQWVVEGRLDGKCEMREVGSSIWEKSIRFYPVLALPEEVGAGTPFHRARKTQNQALYKFPHRGGAALLFSVIGLLMVCPIFSVAAWAMAYGDLEGIAQQRVDPSGQKMLTWAHNLGMIGSIVYAVIFLSFLMVALFSLLL